MMKSIKMVSGLFRNERDREWSERTLGHLLEALYKTDVDYLRFHPNTPPLYRSGVIYCREKGLEDWLSIPEILRRGAGDCEDLACYRAAELTVGGVAARPLLKRRRIGKLNMYHVIVQCADGRTEDPSARLGMGNPETEKICQRMRRA